MAKRDASWQQEQGYENEQAKRRKFDDYKARPRTEPAKVEDIYSARQLQSLLRFQQDIDLRSGIQSFKHFLDSILHPNNPDEVGTQRAILEKFIQSQRPRNGDAHHSFLEDVMQTWAFASQSNNDNLVGSVTAALALLLKALSTQLELRQHGFNLCKTLLRIPQLKLIRRSLSAPKHKPYLISPMLRLLTEIVAFDGGVLAKEVYTHREYTFEPQIIAHHLSGKGETNQDPSRPSMRSNAIQYLLVNLKLQNEGVKADIVKQGNISRALFAHIDQDAPTLITEVLEVLRVHVVSDNEIPRGVKTFFLDDRNLSRILTICRRYSGGEDDEMTDTAASVQQAALDFLRLVCTTPNLGVLINCPGWYSSLSGVDEESTRPWSDFGEPGGLITADSIKIEVRNTTLASFIHILRPFASEQEMQLLIDIFKVAPELVADYFHKKSSFPFDPTLTATWTGYAAFLFSVIRLPVPVDAQSHHLPPLTSVVVESIAPLPITRKALIKCANHNSELVRFFAVRLLTTILEKLQVTTTAWRGRGDSWLEAADHLESQIAQRCLPIKDVTAIMRKNTLKLMQYEASVRLLRSYFEVLPWLALEERLDISATITFELQDLESTDGQDDNDRPLKLITLSHLLTIAQLATGMQWWRKPEGLKYSPFTTLLALAAADQEFAVQNLTLLQALSEETGTEHIAFQALLESLTDKEQRAPAILSFIDECFLRLMRTPIKYADMLDAVFPEADGTGSKSEALPMLLMTLEEQLPHAAKSNNIQAIANWTGRFINALRRMNSTLLPIVKDRIAACLPKDEARRAFLHAYDAEFILNDTTDAPQPRVPEYNGNVEMQNKRNFAALFEAHHPPVESTKLAVLHRWLQQDVEEALGDSLAEPLLLLSSSNDSTRRQAELALAKFIARLDPSDADRLQHYLLLSQLQETIQMSTDHNQGKTRKTPYLLITFAIHAAAILDDPTHVLYPSINAFMNEYPSWHTNKLISYWMRMVLDSPPDNDSHNAAWEVFDWLLTWLYDGLRTTIDMDILRKCRVFEKFLAQHDAAPKATKTKIMELLMRAISLEGGSTTLITRFGGMDWLDTQAATTKDDRQSEFLRSLRKWMWNNCDQERVNEWSRGEIERSVTSQ